MLYPMLKDGKMVVTFLGKDYEVKPDQENILIDGVMFTLPKEKPEVEEEPAEPKKKAAKKAK